MKKTLVSLIAVISAGLFASAQTAQDALTFIEDDPLYNARVSAMAGAFTALGGDVSSININPAGSAVNHFSAFTISPGFYVSKSSTSGTAGFGDGFREREHSTTLPSIGAVFYFDTFRPYGLKGVSFGINANTNRYYTNRVYAEGRQESSSIAGYMAAFAEANEFSTGSFREDGVYDKGQIPWWNAVGWKGALFDPVEDVDGNIQYIGVTENLTPGGIRLGGPLNQSYDRFTDGSKTDIAFTLGFNISDRIYLGSTLGITSIDYFYEDRLSETAENPSDFETNFKSLAFKYFYNASATGVYGKFGIIAVPSRLFRIGAALETPTVLAITDYWSWDTDVNRKDGASNAWLDAQTPRGEYDYKLVSPLKFNIGAALTLGRYAIISADYDFCDYGMAMFRERRSHDQTNFRDSNKDIRDNLKPSHTFRLGAEYRPVNQISLRAGYALRNNGPMNFSCGLGFDSLDTFFFDVAFVGTINPKSYYSPYGEYVEGIAAPEIEIRNNTFNTIFTLGMRF